jgi:hypothetical protein
VVFGKSFRAKRAMPLRSVVSATLSAISLPARALASRSPSSLSGASEPADSGSRAGSKRNSS